MTETATAVGRLMASIFPIVMFILNASSVAVLWFGARRVDSGAMIGNVMTAFLTYLVQILMSVMMATFLLMLASGRRLRRADRRGTGDGVHRRPAGESKRSTSPR